MIFNFTSHHSDNLKMQLDLTSESIDIQNTNQETLDIRSESTFVRNLNISNNQIQSFNFLTNLPNLNSLIADNSCIPHIKYLPLSHLKKLKHLSLRGNNLTDFENIQNLFTEQLNISQNQFDLDSEETITTSMPNLKKVIFGHFHQNLKQQLNALSCSHCYLNSLRLFEKLFIYQYYETYKIGVDNNENQEINLGGINFQCKIQNQFTTQIYIDTQDEQQNIEGANLTNNQKVIVTTYKLISGFQIRLLNQQITSIQQFKLQSGFKADITPQLYKDENMFNFDYSEQFIQQQQKYQNFYIITIECQKQCGVFLFDNNQFFNFDNIKQLTQKQLQQMYSVQYLAGQNNQMRDTKPQDTYNKFSENDIIKQYDSDFEAVLEQFKYHQNEIQQYDVQKTHYQDFCNQNQQKDKLFKAILKINCQNLICLLYKKINQKDTLLLDNSYLYTFFKDDQMIANQVNINHIKLQQPLSGEYKVQVFDKNGLKFITDQQYNFSQSDQPEQCESKKLKSKTDNINVQNSVAYIQQNGDLQNVNIQQIPAFDYKIVKYSEYVETEYQIQICVNLFSEGGQIKHQQIQQRLENKIQLLLQNNELELMQKLEKYQIIMKELLDLEKQTKRYQKIQFLALQEINDQQINKHNIMNTSKYQLSKARVVFKQSQISDFIFEIKINFSLDDLGKLIHLVMIYDQKIKHSIPLTYGCVKSKSQSKTFQDNKIFQLFNENYQKIILEQTIQEHIDKKDNQNQPCHKDKVEIPVKNFKCFIFNSNERLKVQAQLSLSSSQISINYINNEQQHCFTVNDGNADVFYLEDYYIDIQHLQKVNNYDVGVCYEYIKQLQQLVLNSSMQQQYNFQIMPDQLGDFHNYDESQYTRMKLSQSLSTSNTNYSQSYSKSQSVHNSQNIEHFVSYLEFVPEILRTSQFHGLINKQQSKMFAENILAKINYQQMKFSDCAVEQFQIVDFEFQNYCYFISNQQLFLLYFENAEQKTSFAVSFQYFAKQLFDNEYCNEQYKYIIEQHLQKNLKREKINVSSYLQHIQEIEQQRLQVKCVRKVLEKEMNVEQINLQKNKIAQNFYYKCYFQDNIDFKLLVQKQNQNINEQCSYAALCNNGKVEKIVQFDDKNFNINFEKLFTHFYTQFITSINNINNSYLVYVNNNIVVPYNIIDLIQNLNDNIVNNTHLQSVNDLSFIIDVKYIQQLQKQKLVQQLQQLHKKKFLEISNIMMSYLSQSNSVSIQLNCEKYKQIKIITQKREIILQNPVNTHQTNMEQVLIISDQYQSYNLHFRDIDAAHNFRALLIHFDKM